MTARRTGKGFGLMFIVSLYVFTAGGCSTVSVVAKQASKADDMQKTTVVAYWWGASDPVRNADCGGNGLQVVSVKTNWVYSLCAVVTLGAVVPLDVHYRCTTGTLQGGGSIGEAKEARP